MTMPCAQVEADWTGPYPPVHYTRCDQRDCGFVSAVLLKNVRCIYPSCDGTMRELPAPSGASA